LNVSIAELSEKECTITLLQATKRRSLSSKSHFTPIVDTATRQRMQDDRVFRKKFIFLAIRQVNACPTARVKVECNSHDNG